MAKDFQASSAFVADVFPENKKNKNSVAVKTVVPTKYASAEYMLTHPEDFGGILAVLKLLDDATKSG